MIALGLLCLLCATVPSAIFFINLRCYREPVPLNGTPLPRVSILVPARNEEATIGACVEHLLASSGIGYEVLVMDDSSTDRTGEIVRAAAAGAPPGTLQLLEAPPLPHGWNGKQHACWSLAQSASGDLLCFVDADVQVAPQAVARMAQFLIESGSSLVSGFPRQITVTWLEQLLLPLIHFILLGFLPLPQMRRHGRGMGYAGYAAGCGQFLLVGREAYFASGGHAAIRSTMHDGIKLPRRLRLEGYHTDLADLTDFASCRMYRSAGEVWSGLAKNATEGMAAPRAIVPATLLLVLGQMLPFVLLLVAAVRRLPTVVALCAAAALAAWLPRALAVRRFHQPAGSALLHPLGVAVLLVLQWYALVRTLAGARVRWKTRAYPAR